MLHGRLAWIFGLQEGGNGQVNYSLHDVDDFCDETYSEQDLRQDLIQTLCEEAFDFYGVAKHPGVGFPVFEFKHKYHGSTCLDVIRALVRGLGYDDILAELCSQLETAPNNLALLHNLDRLFAFQEVTKKINPDHYWQLLGLVDKRPEEVRIRERLKPTIDKELPFEDRWMQFDADYAYPFIYRYFHLENDENSLRDKLMNSPKKKLMLQVMPTGNRFKSWKKFKATFEES